MSSSWPDFHNRMSKMGKCCWYVRPTSINMCLIVKASFSDVVEMFSLSTGYTIFWTCTFIFFKKENGSLVNSWSLCQTPIANQSEEQEVIELKPIGQGVRMLEPGSSLRSLPISYPVQG